MTFFLPFHINNDGIMAYLLLSMINDHNRIYDLSVHHFLLNFCQPSLSQVLMKLLIVVMGVSYILQTDDRLL